MNKKILAVMIFIILGLVGIIVWQEVTINDGKLHVVFCDVGQGDAIFIRTPKKTDILIDGGPDRRVLDCLSQHMPFWDRTIDVVILSHPHQDHFAGLIDVLQSYTVLAFDSENLINKSAGFGQLQNTLTAKAVKTRYLSAGDALKTKDGLSMEVLAPSLSFLDRTSPNGEIGESGEFASLIILMSFGESTFLLTGDSQAPQLGEAVGKVGEVGILQVPHHGSKTGLTKDILNVILPKLAVISVGKNNRYGHPNTEVIKILRDEDIKILRTDEAGEVEIVSDGKSWLVR